MRQTGPLEVRDRARSRPRPHRLPRGLVQRARARPPPRRRSGGRCRAPGPWAIFRRRRQAAGGDDREDLRRAAQDRAVARGRHRPALRDPGRREPRRARRRAHHARLHHRQAEGVHPPDPRSPLRHGLHRLLRLVLGGRRARAAPGGVPAAPEDERGQLPGPPGRARRRWAGSRRRSARFNDIKGQRYRIYAASAPRSTASSASPPWCWPAARSCPPSSAGAIDGAEWINCYDDKILGIDKVAKFHYAPGMHEPTTVGEFIINKGKWDALPADLKEIVKTSVQASYWNHFVRFQEKTAKACQELLASGVKIIKTTDELNKALPQGVRRGLAGGRGQGRVLPEGDRLAEEVLQPDGAVPHVVLAELQLHRRALLQGQDLAEVAGSVRRPPGRPAAARPAAPGRSTDRPADPRIRSLPELGARLPRPERRNRCGDGCAARSTPHQDVSPAFRTTIEAIDRFADCVRPHHRLAHHPDDDRRHLGGRGPPLLPRPDHLGLRRDVHAVRHALHAGHGLHPHADRPRPHRHAVPELVDPPPELGRRDRLPVLLLPRDGLPASTSAGRRPRTRGRSGRPRTRAPGARSSTRSRPSSR